MKRLIEFYLDITKAQADIAITKDNSIAKHLNINNLNSNLKIRKMTLLLSMPGGTEWILIFIVFGLMLIPGIFYLITLQSTFDAISVENRKMPSSNVWLLLIPLFGAIWHFIIVSNLADSIKAEANSKNLKIEEPRPAYNIGLAMCILNCLSIIPVLNILTSIAGLICWILYWVKINSYKNILLTAKYNSVGTSS